MPESISNPVLMPNLTFSYPEGNSIVPENSSELDSSQPGWISRNKKLLAAGAFLVAAAAVAAPEASDTFNALKDKGDWAVPLLLATDLAWDIGAVMVIGAAGKKLGNPLKIRQKFKETMTETMTEVRHNTTFRIGRAVNLFGEVGTFTLATAGSFAYLPPSAWPVSIGAISLYVAPGAAFQWSIYKANRNEKRKLVQNEEI